MTPNVPGEWLYLTEGDAIADKSNNASRNRRSVLLMKHDSCVYVQSTRDPSIPVWDRLLLRHSFASGLPKEQTYAKQLPVGSGGNGMHSDDRYCGRARRS